MLCLEHGGSATCETMPAVRVIVLLLVVTLTGPSIGSVLCDWTCAAKHQQPVASNSCHGHADPLSTPAVAPGHQCHDLASPPESILTDGRQAGASSPAIVGSSTVVISIESAARGIGTSRSVAHAPPLPPLTPLRI